MTKYPYYRVYDEKGEQYADCGRERTAQNLILINHYVQQLTYRRIDAPKPINPETVDVGVVPVELDFGGFGYYPGIQLRLQVFMKS